MPSKRLESGSMNLQGTFQADATSANTADTSGSHVPSWQTFGTANWWLALEQLYGRELERAMALTPEATHKLTCYWFSGLTPKHRVVIGSRVFEIGVVNNVNEQNYKYECIVCEKLT